MDSDSCQPVVRVGDVAFVVAVVVVAAVVAAAAAAADSVELP